MNHTMRKIKVYRGIMADSIESIDLGNLGVHWSADQYFADGAGKGENTKLSDAKLGSQNFILSTWVELESVNFDATVESNNEYPHEYEIVLSQNLYIEVEINDDFGYVVFTGKANTGTRSDDWANKSYGNAYSDFENLVNSLSEWADVK